MSGRSGARRDARDPEKGLREDIGCERVAHGEGLSLRGKGWRCLGPIGAFGRSCDCGSGWQGPLTGLERCSTSR